MHKYLLLLLSCCSLGAVAQDTLPVIKGKVNISISRGTIACDLSISNMPRIADYYIRLNSGMNIRYFRSGTGTGPMRYDKSTADSLSTGESNAYIIKSYNKWGKFLPKQLHMNYVGMFPVIADTAAAEDWRGNIAFNGQTLRMEGSQGAWYPVLYDAATDTRYDKVSYDLDINCEDCKYIYVNGSRPVQGSHASFKSEIPYELTIFCGDYRTVEINNTWFLNPVMADSSIKKFEAVTRGYKNYFEKHLGIPYKGIAAYIHTTPVSRYNSWMFNSYPAIVDIGFEKNDLNWSSPYFAHELAHFYFGTTRAFNSELGDAITEGFAEYLSMHIARKFSGDSLFKAKIQSKLWAMRNFKPVSFAAVRSQQDYNDRELYSYYYAPLIFTSIEKEIGEEAMWQWMKSLLRTPAKFTNYNFLDQCLADVVHDKNKMDNIRSRYFSGDNVMDHLKELGTAVTPTVTTTNVTTQEAKTYYYFLFSRPMVDAGAEENKTVRHTEIGKLTCTPSELPVKSRNFFKQFEGCENDGGCSGDFNTYDSMEMAQSALQRWLKPFAGNPKFVIKVVKLQD